MLNNVFKFDVFMIHILKILEANEILICEH